MRKSVLVSIILISVASVGLIGSTTSKLNLKNQKSETVSSQEEILAKPVSLELKEEVATAPEIKIEEEKKIESKVKKLPVGYHANDLTEKSNLNVTEMENVLKDAPRGTLAKYAKYFVDAEEKYSVNAFALAAIAAQESAWGTSDRAINQNNLTGYAVYNSKSRGSSFSSAGESIMLTAKLLKENYLTPGAENFNGTSIQAANKDYCLKDDSSETDYGWSKNINSIAEELEKIYYDKFR